MSIPSDEDFARAERLDKERSRNLDLVAESVKQHFLPICRLHRVFLVSQRDVNFRAIVFFKKDRDLKACERSGVTKEVETFIREELERVGRGKMTETTVAFEFDSDENVDRSYDGDYFARLR